MGDSKGTNVKGENNGTAKLSDQDVQDIRYVYEAHRNLPCKQRKELGVTQPALAEAYGVHKGHISRIISGRNWSHLT